jgi:uncharacterized BrkB/YihY/UPF0761 family membrane protein
MMTSNNRIQDSGPTYLARNTAKTRQKTVRFVHCAEQSTYALYTRIMGLGRMLITAGLLLVALGVLVTFAGRLPFRIGRLPGDIYIHGKNTTFYFPLVTCLLASIVLSLILWIFRR